MKKISGSVTNQTHRLAKGLGINFQAVISAAMRQIIGEESMYIASSSCDEGKKQVRALAKELQSRGYFWHNGFDWTPVANEEREEYQFQRNLVMDKAGAVGADLFVLLDTDGLARNSRGAYVELGLRLGANKTVIYIGSDASYFFHRDPLVQAYHCVEHFLDLYFGSY